MTAVISLANVLLLASLAFLWWRRITILKPVFWPALLVKLCSGILLGLLYMHYYTVGGDTFHFFQDGDTLAKLAAKDFNSYVRFLWNGDESFPVWAELRVQQSRSLFLSKLISLFNLLTFSNYWITSLYFSFISFAASWLLVSSISKHFPHLKTGAVIAFLFFPSVVFWSSGIIKESLAMASLCFLSFIFLKLWIKERPHLLEWLLAIWTLWILWNLKYYFAAVFIPVVLTSYVVHNFLTPLLKFKKGWVEYLLWIIVFLVPISIASFIHPNFYPERFLDVIVSNNRAFQEISQPDDLIMFSDLNATGSSIVYNAPLALISGLFRPFLWESGNFLQFLVALENSALIVLLIASFRGMTRIMNSPDRLLILSLIMYCVFLCVFITLSTPNFGTLARYRIGYISFFAFLVMINNPLVTWLEKFLQRFVQVKE